jgi:hypothetical protein
MGRCAAVARAPPPRTASKANIAAFFIAISSSLHSPPNCGGLQIEQKGISFAAHLPQNLIPGI